MRDARAERLCVTRIGAVKGQQPDPGLPSPASLKALSARVNAETNRLNESLKEAQSLIGACRMGVTASVGLPNGKTLAYGRVGREWCLHIEDTQTPILRASREDRIAAAGALGALVDALSEAAARATSDTKAVSAILDELAEDLSAG